MTITLLSYSLKRFKEGCYVVTFATFTFLCEPSIVRE